MDKIVVEIPNISPGEMVLDDDPCIIRYMQGGRYAEYEPVRLTPDNNAAERSIKPIVVDRKNWLFAGSPDGAKASCLFFSLIETAKAKNITPYGYLKEIFDQVAINGTEVNPEALLPWNVNKDLLMKMPIKGL